MTVLMFGWEFPPHISGGLGTACFGLTKYLIEEGIKILFVVPKAHGDESLSVINASDVLVYDDIVIQKETSIPEISADNFIKIETNVQLVPYSQGENWLYADNLTQWNFQSQAIQTVEHRTTEGKRYLFTGLYGPSLLDEVEKYSEVASIIGHQQSYDIIHAHDWLTYPAGIAAKRVSGKPLIVHVHATEFDRAEEKNIDLRVFAIEKAGFIEADKILAVSQWTKDILVSKYNVASEKIEVVHNGVIQNEQPISPLPKISDQVVTFLGRITWQKGPQYFVEAARKVLQHFPDTHFVVAGSGDMLPQTIETVARLGMSHRFHFTGFLKGEQINQVWSVSDVYVMPSVSEPFGITPLEAIHAGVPVIMSNQSGVAEVIDHAVKVDFWDTAALANAIIALLRHKSLSDMMITNSKVELPSISWQKAAKKINKIYHEIYEATDATIH